MVLNVVKDLHLRAADFVFPFGHTDDSCRHGSSDDICRQQIFGWSIAATVSRYQESGLA